MRARLLVLYHSLLNQVENILHHFTQVILSKNHLSKRINKLLLIVFREHLLTETSSSSIEFESRWTVEWQTSSCHPLAGVRGQLTLLQASVVEKPAAFQVVGFRAQMTTHQPCRVAHFDCIETSRNHSNVSVQHVLVTNICHTNRSVMLMLRCALSLLRQSCLIRTFVTQQVLANTDTMQLKELCSLSTKPEHAVAKNVITAVWIIRLYDKA